MLIEVNTKFPINSFLTGYNVAKVEWIEDVDANTSASNDTQERLQFIRQFGIQNITMHANKGVNVQEMLGTLPTSDIDLVFWIASYLSSMGVLSQSFVYHLAFSPETKTSHEKRVYIIFERLKELAHESDENEN